MSLTKHPYSISKICLKFQVISSHIFEVDDELLDEDWAKIVQSENISTTIYVKCDKVYRSKVCVQEFSYFVSGLKMELEKSEYFSPVRKKIGCRWRNTTSHVQFFSSNWYEPMAWWLRLVQRVGRHWFDSWWVLKRFAVPQLFCEALSPQCTDTHAFYIAVLSTIFFFLDFVNGDLALTAL